MANHMARVGLEVKRSTRHQKGVSVYVSEASASNGRILNNVDCRCGRKAHLNICCFVPMQHEESSKESVAHTLWIPSADKPQG